jgi:YVTN family beta-propeller protein
MLYSIYHRSNSIPSILHIIFYNDRNTPILMATERNPSSITISCDGKRVHVAYQDSSILSVFATDTNKVIAAIHVRCHLSAIAITHDGKSVYVADQDNDIVFVFAIDTGKEIAAIRVGRNPSEIRITPDGKGVWVKNLSDDTVSIIATATHEVIATLKDGIPVESESSNRNIQSPISFTSNEIIL